MTSGQPATSLWLVPAEPHRAQLRSRIDQLAVRHGTPTFEPHVTLTTGVVDHAAALAAIERVAATWAPLDVVAGATAHGPDRFKAVYVELPDARLHDIAAALCDELGLPFAADELRPHISLIYAAGLPPDVRAAMAADHDIAGQTLRLDTLTASVPGNDIDDVARWQQPIVRPLGGVPELAIRLAGQPPVGERSMRSGANVDLHGAIAFMAGHGRLLDRRRLALLLGRDDGRGVLAAVEGHGNPDGGYGWGIEPDLRAAGSQPTGAMHALEVFAEVAAATGVTTPRAAELCAWLERHTLADGGLPFTLPVADPAGCAPLWLGEDHATSSLQMTAQVAAMAHLLARHDPAVADHPWLTGATEWCLDAIAGQGDAPHAYELLFAVRFLDIVADADDRALALLQRLHEWVPADGVVPVAGGAAGEALHPLDLAPRAGGAARRLFTDDAITADLERLAGQQQPDGGWIVEFTAASPAADLEWRGYTTVAALKVLRPHGLVAPPP